MSLLTLFKYFRAKLSTKMIHNLREQMAERHIFYCSSSMQKGKERERERDNNGPKGMGMEGQFRKLTNNIMQTSTKKNSNKKKNKETGHKQICTTS